MKNLLAVRVDPWQLFRFKKYCSFSGKRPSVVIQEALQVYFSSVPKGTTSIWLNEYSCAKREEIKDAHETEGIK